MKGYDAILGVDWLIEYDADGRVEELLVAEELWNDHKKLIFFPFSSAATYTNRPLEVDQSALCQYKKFVHVVKIKVCQDILDACACWTI
ncbi:hypothetical protein Taro_047994 [Colocasia esculenta]|uniref:Uncharacterized protein n=1 Tax=Colocasia esculenta TaxID=4460 RepID=A0A843X1X1_COLES|nr:hypothetical protein [Colocasia esculenta]